MRPIIKSLLQTQDLQNLIGQTREVIGMAK
ncbi:MAG: hypothetical protein JWQ78_1466 [Sediminibacterium sp.]|nr:hypothetical protein [Sediminibacterium sp.]